MSGSLSAVSRQSLNVTCDHHDCSAFANLDAILPPMADSILKYTGMVVIVTLVGPCGQEGGNVIVQRCVFRLPFVPVLSATPC
jgi:hypothetical protein